MLLIRFYIIVVLCFFNQEIHISQEIFNQVELRDILVKHKRKTIYNWTGDWVEEVILGAIFEKIYLNIFCRINIINHLIGNIP